MFRKIARAGFVLTALLAASGIAFARPQVGSSSQQSDSAAAAARKSRDQKKAEPKSARVWDNDNIVVPAAGIEVVGPDANAPAPDANAAAAAGDQTGAAPAVPAGLSPDEVAHIQAAIKEALAKIEELKADVNLSQRKYDLDAQQYYSKPDYAADKDGQKAVNQEKSALDDKKQQLQLAQQILAQLQAKIGVKPAPEAPAAKAPPSKPVETMPGSTTPADTKGAIPIAPPKPTAPAAPAPAPPQP